MRHSILFVAILASVVSFQSGCTKKSKMDSANTLNLATGAKIKGLDPAFADDLYSGNEVGRVYEGLLEYHYLKRPYALKPSLAESMPEVSADGKTYTFKLKKGVLFQDDVSFKATSGKGREMTAEDVIYSWKRLADPKIASSGWWIFEGKIAGLDAWRDESSKAGTTDYSKKVEGLTAVDPYTLQIKLNQRSAQFPYFVAMSFAVVVPKEAVEHYGKEFLNHPVGTGPFKLESFNGASKIVWVKNPTFRNETYPSEGEAGDKEAGLLADAGKKLPLSDKIIVHIHEESQPAWLNFMAGKIDMSAIPKDNFDQAIKGKELTPELKQKNVQLHISPGLDVTHESFNMTHPLMGKNKLLRQALSLAHDPAPVVEKFYNGRAIPAQGPIPPQLSGYDAEYKNAYRQYDLAKAKELLAKAGYPEGKGLPPIEYNTTSNSTSRQMTEYLQMQFKQLGVELKVNTFSWPEFQASVKNRRGMMWGFAWGADYPDAENFLQLFYSKNASPGPNDSNYTNPEFDALYEKSLTMTDTPERTELYRQMVKMLAEDAPWIWGVHRLQYTLTHPWLKNFKPHDFDHSRSKYLRLDASLRK